MQRICEADATIQKQKLTKGICDGITPISADAMKCNSKVPRSMIRGKNFQTDRQILKNGIDV